jgi:hypothetical protein
MSEITKIKCDGCGEETDDVYAKVGWMTMEPHGGCSFNISVTGGRDEHRQAKTVIYENVSNPIHFCCAECFCDFVNSKARL